MKNTHKIYIYITYVIFSHSRKFIPAKSFLFLHSRKFKPRELHYFSSFAKIKSKNFAIFLPRKTLCPRNFVLLKYEYFENKHCIVWSKHGCFTDSLNMLNTKRLKSPEREGFRGSNFVIKFRGDLISQMAQLQNFRRDLISQFFLIPRNPQNLTPLKYMFCWICIFKN